MSEKGDRVLINGETPGVVVQDGVSKSLVETAGYEPGTYEQDWYDNERLTLTARKASKIRGDEPNGIRVIQDQLPR